MRLLFPIAALAALASCQLIAGYELARAPALDGHSSEVSVADGGGDVASTDGGNGDGLLDGDGRVVDGVEDGLPMLAESGVADLPGADLHPACAGLVVGQPFAGWVLPPYNDITDDTIAFVERLESAKVPTSWPPGQVVNCLLDRDGIHDIDATSGNNSPTFPLGWGFFASPVWRALQSAIENQIGLQALEDVWFHSWGEADPVLVAVLFYGTQGDVVYLRGYQLVE